MDRRDDWRLKEAKLKRRIGKRKVLTVETQTERGDCQSAIGLIGRTRLDGRRRDAE